MDQHDAFLTKQELQDTWDSLESADTERRRPERLDHVNPVLIPLLRSMLAPGLPLNTETDLAFDRGKLAPSTGIAVAILLSLLLWAVIGLAAWAILG